MAVLSSNHLSLDAIARSGQTFTWAPQADKRDSWLVASGTLR